MSQELSSNIDECSEELDPRIENELKRLNSTFDEINHLATKLDEARVDFNNQSIKAKRELNALTRKIKRNHIDIAGPYYETLKECNSAEDNCQQAAVRFKNASDTLQEAQETLYLEEENFMSQESNDVDALERVNQAIIRVNEAQAEKALIEEEHRNCATALANAKHKLQQWTKVKSSIKKSRPYFEKVNQCHDTLKLQQQKVMALEQSVDEAKLKHSEALERLDFISKEIHERRTALKRAETTCQLPISST